MGQDRRSDFAAGNRWLTHTGREVSPSGLKSSGLAFTGGSRKTTGMCLALGGESKVVWRSEALLCKAHEGLVEGFASTDQQGDRFVGFGVSEIQSHGRQ